MDCLLWDRIIHRDLSVNHNSNSFDRPRENPAFEEPPLKISRDADRYDHREGNDDFTQAGNLHRLLPQDERHRLHIAIADSLQGVPEGIIERQLGHFEKAEPAYAEGVRKALQRYQTRFYRSAESELVRIRWLKRISAYFRSVIFFDWVTLPTCRR